MDLDHAISIHMVSAVAARAHNGMNRADGITPYIVHPARVALLAQHNGGNHTAVICAWLHDVFEDCPDYSLEIRKTIDTLPLSRKEILDIHAILDALTKNPLIKKEGRMNDSLDRILLAPREAVLIKLCDRTDNLVDARSRDDDFKKRYLHEAQDILNALHEKATMYGYTDAIGQLKEIMNRF